MKVYVLLAVFQEDYSTCIINIYKSLSDANAAMDAYNDISLDDYYAIVEEETII